MRDLSPKENQRHEHTTQIFTLLESFVLVRVTIAVIKHYNQSNLGRNLGLFDLLFPKSGQELKQGCNLGAEVAAEAVEPCCLLACSLWLAQLS